MGHGSMVGSGGAGRARPTIRLSSPTAGTSFKPKERLGGGGGGGGGGSSSNKRIEQLNKSGEVSLKRRWSDDEVENLKAGVDK
jgi:hypothetical protein